MNHFASYFLDETGVIWACGTGEDLGMGTKDPTVSKYVPEQIKYFIENGIVIKDVKCGYEHVLVLDVNGNVYAWGANGNGQCGQHDTKDEFLRSPKKIC